MKNIDKDRNIERLDYRNTSNHFFMPTIALVRSRGEVLTLPSTKLQCIYIFKVLTEIP
jgi:hypothetical protein